MKNSLKHRNPDSDVLIAPPSCSRYGNASLKSRFVMGMLTMMDFKGRILKRVQSGQAIIDPRSVQPKPDSAFARKHQVSATKIDGTPVYTVSPKSKPSGKTILYLHGGAYSVSFVKDHWKLFAYLVEQNGCTLVAPDYPLPPEADWTVSWAIVKKIYGDLSQAGKNTNLLMMGDSAGGGFALSFSQMLKIKNLPQPQRLILLSPWLDITMTNPAIPDIMDSDPFLSVEALRICGKRWAGRTDPADWHLSPINGSCKKLPPMAVFTGTRDILNPDARKLHNLSTGPGYSLTFHEYPDMMHVWMLFDFPESVKARREILDLIT